jgi:hypothetical protein
MTDVAEHGSKFMRDLAEAASRNPLSAALIGMGALWLFSAGRSGIGPAGKASLSAASERLQNGASAAFEGSTQFGREQADKFSDYARAIPEIGMEMIENAGANVAELFRAQPLAPGALGLAVGAGSAAALPASKTETELLGEPSAAVKDSVQQFAAAKTAELSKVAENALNAAAEEARNQGLTLDAAKSAGRDMADRVGRVIDAAGQRAGEPSGTTERGPD